VEIHAETRNALLEALVGRAQGEARHHIASGVLAALRPDGPNTVEWTAQMMRLQASGLELTKSALRQAAFMYRQSRRARRKLTGGD
jgi:hypothetical protein